MEAFFWKILKLYILILITESSKCSANFFNAEKKLGPSNQKKENITRWPRQVDGRSWIWKEYEFGSGVGNREELLIEDIELWSNSRLNKDINNWQFLESNGENYVAGVKGSKLLLLYILDMQTKQITYRTSLSFHEKIKTFKILSLPMEADVFSKRNRIFLILSTETNDTYHKINCFYLNSNAFVRINVNGFNLISHLKKAIKQIEYFVFNNRHKLLLLYEYEIWFKSNFSLVEVYDMTISDNLLNLRLCHDLLLTGTSNVQLCPSQEDSIIFSFFGDDHVVLYKYKDEDFVRCTFTDVQNITIPGLINTICFESGNINYLASSGILPSLFTFHNIEYTYDKRMEKIFSELGNVRFIQNLPVDTYRDEVILLIQLKNSTILALSWQDLEFKWSKLPNNMLDNVDLSMATIIPAFGLLCGNSLIKFKVRLNELPRPKEREIEKILKTKYALEDVLEQQKMVIIHTNLKFNDSYLKNPEIKGFFNLTEVNTNNLTVTDTNDFPISLGFHNNYTLRELEKYYQNTERIINHLETKLNITEYNLKNAVTNITENIPFNDIDLTGDFEIKGTLTFEKIEIDYLNDISINDITNNDFLNGSIKITGLKSFPTIKFTDGSLKIGKLNGIPLKNHIFDDLMRNYSGIDLSEISKLETQKNLHFSKILGFKWIDLMQNLIFKNERAIIPGETYISGQITSSYIHMDYLNDLHYPSDYIVKNGPEDAHMTSSKTFESLTVGSLVDVKTINGIDADEFIFLNTDQTLKNLITFENIETDESFRIDGNVAGLPEQKINPNLTLLNSNIVESNTMFTSLVVSGTVYVKNSVDEIKWSEIDDLIFKDQENVSVTGKKTFLSNVHIADNLEIKNELINGHFTNDFITINTRQILPNLSKITSEVKFIDVSYEDLKNFEEKINTYNNGASMPVCLNKTVFFNHPPIVDEFSSLFINENISGLHFLKNLESLLKNVYFENLNVKKLIVVKDLIPTIINGVNFQEFQNSRISKAGYQNIIGNITIQNLETSKLNAEFVNNRSISDLENIIDVLNDFYHDVLNGNESLDSLNVTGSVKTSYINEHDLIDVLDVQYSEEFSFKTNEFIENVVVEGLINGLNFTKIVKDTALKTEDYVVIKGPKKMKKIKTRNLHIKYINGRGVEDIVSADKNQTLIGPVKIKGSVVVEKKFNSTSKINSLIFRNISDSIHKVNDNMYKLTGDFSVENQTYIKDLNVFGQVQQKDINEFLESLIYLHRKEITVMGTKKFNNSVHFSDNIIVTESLNEISLKNFYENAIFIDRPMSVYTELLFESDILLEGNLTVRNNLKAGTIKGIKIDDLLENAVYLNRPTAITEDAILSNVIFKSDITVKHWNNIDTDTFTTLYKDEELNDILNCVDIEVDNIETLGFVNGINMTEFYENTFMLSSDQNITGRMSFLNNIYIKEDFNSRFINNVDVTKSVSLYDNHPLIGNFIFDSTIFVNDDLCVLGNLSGNNYSMWLSNTVTAAPRAPQIISGNWTVYGNVAVKRNLHGSGVINGLEISKINDDFEDKKKKLETMLSVKTNNLKGICEDLQELKMEAENMLYKFKSFDYLQILEFDQKVSSTHHFELKNIDYVMVNFDTCHLDIFAFTNKGFVLATNYSNFGYIKHYLTLNCEEKLYFVTVGKPACGKNSGNIWSLDNDQLKYILDLRNVTDVEKLGNYGFAVVVGREVHEWSITDICNNKFTPVNVIPIADRKVQFFVNENDTLLASRDTIYDLPTKTLAFQTSKSRTLQFEEFENPFSTNSIITFQAGVYRKEYILFQDESISRNYVFICNNDLSRRNILQTISANKPGSFLILNFDKFQETLLIFSENKRKIQIYEYAGIEGFTHHSSIKIKVDKIFTFQLRMHSNFVKKHCLAIIENNKVTILEAKMYGERLDMNVQLKCGAT